MPSLFQHDPAPVPARSAPSPLSIWGGLTTVYLIWGSTYLAIKFAVESLPPFMMAAVRFLIAGAVLLAWRWWRGDPAPSWPQLRSVAIVGLFLLLGGNGCVVWAEQRIPSGVTSLLVATVPLWMTLLDTLRPGGRRPEGWTVVAVLLGLVGVGILIGPEQLGIGGQIDLLGAGVVVVGAFSWSIGSIYSRHAPLPSSPLLGTGLEMVAGGIGLLLLSLVTGEWTRVDPAAVAPRSLLALGYLIVFGSWVAFSAYTWLLRVAPTALVATYAYVNPLVAIALGSLLGSETLSPRVLLATAVIVGAVALITALQPARGRVENSGHEQGYRRSDKDLDRAHE